MTSILCHTGLMTHVQDLVDYLQSQDIFVAVAFKRLYYLDEQSEMRLLERLGTTPYLLYDTEEELKDFVLENKCNLIHAHSHATFESATEVSLQLQIPLIVTLHSVFPWHRFYQKTLQTATDIIAVGPAQASSARNFGHKIKIVANGIDTTTFVPSWESGAEGGVINVLWYGRVDGPLSRGLFALDGVVPQLPANIRLTALGSADFVPKHIPLLPWTDNPLPYLQQAQITFGHSRALREAMAAGSIGILLAHGYGGMVTEDWLQAGKPMDAFREYRLPKPQTRKLLRDLLELVKRKDLIQLRHEARRLAEKYFDLAEMGRKTLEIYAQNLANR